MEVELRTNKQGTKTDLKKYWSSKRSVLFPLIGGGGGVDTYRVFFGNIHSEFCDIKDNYTIHTNKIHNSEVYT